jgi:hypothetical protein
MNGHRFMPATSMKLAGKAFEAEMFVRTSLVSQEPAETAAMLQSPIAAQDMARFFGAAW